MTDAKVLASPQSVIWGYYECLNRQINRITTDENDKTQKQEIVLALFLSVSVIETFINAFFRVVVEEDGFTHAKEEILSDFQNRASLEKKLRQWPKKVFGKTLDFNSASVKSFIDLKNHRNSLMHFSSSHDTIEVSGPIYLHGLADMSAISSLSLKMAKTFPIIIRDFSYEILSARGISVDNLPHAFYQWFGDPSYIINN